MTEFRFYQIDAFAEGPLMGNPAAVMPVEAFPDADVMLAIAAENNLAETAFIVPTGKGVWDLRWFTPTVEVELCGHATLASAHAIWAHSSFDGDEIGFDTLSGRLTVVRLEDGRIEMDFPAKPAVKTDGVAGLGAALGAEPVEVWNERSNLAVFGSADEVRALKPDMGLLAKVPGIEGRDHGHVIATAPGDDGFDVVSRFFAPGSGINEDPTTGSAHCIIAPYWSARLGKNELKCFQAYPGRGGVMTTRMEGDRVKLIGRARTVIEGVFHL